jgi:cell division protein FtsQ
VKPGRRRTSWRRWLRLVKIVVLLVMVGCSCWFTTAGLLGAPVLQVSRIAVSGHQQLSKGEVLALVAGIRGRNILSLRLEEWRARVLACPWVESVTLRRSLPSTIEVVVVERHPLAIGRIDDELFLVDDHGRVIDEYGPRYAELDLPIVDGLRLETSADATLNERRAALAERVLGAVRRQPELARRISQLDVSDPHNAVVIVDQDTARVRLGDDRFLERLQSYLDLAPALRDQVPAIDYVDLRFGERVYVGAQASTVPIAAPVTGRRTGASPASNH